MNNLLKNLVFGIAAVACAGSVQAVPTLQLSDGVNSVTLAQGGVPVLVGAAVTGGGGFAYDSSTPGQVFWSGRVGAWSVNVTTGLTDPILGTPTRPHMDLNSVNNSTIASTLSLLWSDTDFGPSTGNALAKIGGTVNGGGGSLTFKTFGDAGNAVFGMTTPLTSLGAFGPGAFSGTANGPSLALLGGLYSLTEQVLLTHTAAGSSSFNAELEVPDAGTTLVLLGSSLTLLGFVGRSRKLFRTI